MIKKEKVVQYKIVRTKIFETKEKKAFKKLLGAIDRNFEREFKKYYKHYWTDTLPVIPVELADWIDMCKDHELSIATTLRLGATCTGCEVVPTTHQMVIISRWIAQDENDRYETFTNAWHSGYKAVIIGKIA